MESIFIGTLTAIDFVQLSFYVFDMSHGFETIAPRTQRNIASHNVSCAGSVSTEHTHTLMCVACEYNILIFILCVTLLPGSLCASCTMTIAAYAARSHRTLSLRFYFRFRSMRYYSFLRMFFHSHAHTPSLVRSPKPEPLPQSSVFFF